IIDLLASLLSGGNSTADIGKLEAETSLSQVFICINRDALGEESELASKINEVIEHFQSANRQQEDQPIRYPGEATIIRRKRQLSDGIFVEDDIWKQVIRMQKEQ
ncbi:MAG: Ldh family oxidoreductase, partial [Saprospiraceae bacterium]|nr:Ldh family oxidoreductase [Saprospiraceae bacterium]